MTPASRPIIACLPAGLLLTGCRLEDHSPTIDVLGSYFPAWMICIVTGVTLTLIARQLFIGFKLDVYLRPAPVIYFCLMVLFTLAVWLAFFQN